MTAAEERLHSLRQDLYFYQEALRLTECYAGMLSKLEPYRKNKKQKLCIGTLPILTQYDLTARLKSFTETYPQIDFSFEEAEEAELLVACAKKNMIILLHGKICFQN